MPTTPEDSMALLASTLPTFQSPVPMATDSSTTESVTLMPKPTQPSCMAPTTPEFPSDPALDSTQSPTDSDTTDTTTASVMPKLTQLSSTPDTLATHTPTVHTPPTPMLSPPPPLASSTLPTSDSAPTALEPLFPAKKCAIHHHNREPSTPILLATKTL